MTILSKNKFLLKLIRALRFNKKHILLLIAAHFITLQTFSQPVEYTFKALYIEKFTRFIEWPEDSTKDKQESFVIGVYGKTPFIENLNNIFSIQRIDDRPVIIKEIHSTNNLRDVHILFIAKEKKDSLSEIIKKIKDKSILTIGDTPGFSEKGVLINFYIEEDEELQFEINETALARTPLKMSFYLLNMARIVDPLTHKTQK